METVNPNHLERNFGQTGGIKFRGVKGKLLPLACADVVMEIDYHLEYQPTIKQIKQFRFKIRPTEKRSKVVKSKCATVDR